jgi:hypothetical protein
MAQLVRTLPGAALLCRLYRDRVLCLHQEVGSPEPGRPPVLSCYAPGIHCRAAAKVGGGIPVWRDPVYGHSLLKFAQGAPGVTATLRKPDGGTMAPRGAYLAGCDGGASPVRRQLSIRLRGEAICCSCARRRIAATSSSAGCRSATGPATAGTTMWPMCRHR